MPRIKPGTAEWEVRTLPLRYYAVPVKVGLHQGAEDPIESVPINKLVEVGRKTRKVQKKMEPADDFFSLLHPDQTCQRWPMVAKNKQTKSFEPR